MKKELFSGRSLIVIFFTLFMAVMTFNLVVYPACALGTMKIYGIEQAGLTTLSSVTSVVGLLAGLVFGPLIDKKGSRNVILISLIIGIVLFFVRAFVTMYFLAIVLTFLASFFISVCQVAASKVLDTWFSKESVGVAIAFQAGGAGIGSASAFFIASAIGLRNSLLLIGGACTVLLILWIIVGKDGPVAVQNAVVPKDGVAKVYKSSYVWLISVAYACCVSGTLLINTYCINAFLAKGMSPESAALMGTAINLSLFVGAYLGTLFMSIVKRYNLVLAICLIGGAIGYIGSWLVPLGTATWVFMIFGGLIMGGSILMCVSRTPLIPLTGQFPQECLGTAAGALEMIKGVISFILPIVVASIFQTNFDAIFITFGILCLVAFITGCVLVPEVGPKGKLYKKSMTVADKIETC